MNPAPSVDCEPAWADDWEPGDHTPSPFELRQAEIRDLKRQRAKTKALWTAHDIEPIGSGVHLRLKEATVRLGARSRTHAVVIALRRRIIRFDDLEPATEPTPAEEGRADRAYWTTRYDA